MSIYSSSVKNPISTIMVFIAILVFGVYSFVKLPVDFYPEMEFPAIMVFTSYNGANASDIEANISKPLENSLNIVSNLKQVYSTSRDNISVVTLEFEYQLSAPVTGLRVGIYLSTMRGEYVLTSFDTDEPSLFEKHGTRNPAAYISRAVLPADIFNEGRYSVGVNASSFGVRRYFMDENALAFNVDISGAPGTQWPEPRVGPIRPRLEWKIEKLD